MLAHPPDGQFWPKEYRHWNLQYDPASLGRPAWNAGRMAGIWKPFKQRQIWAVRISSIGKDGCATGAF